MCRLREPRDLAGTDTEPGQRAGLGRAPGEQAATKVSVRIVTISV